MLPNQDVQNPAHPISVYCLYKQDRPSWPAGRDCFDNASPR